MILRLWKGKVLREVAEEYTDYQYQVGPPGYRDVSGNLAIFMLAREYQSMYEIAMVTLWESWEAIEAFAGKPMDRAVYYDRDFDYLIDPPKRVEHFEVLAHQQNSANEHQQACFCVVDNPITTQANLPETRIQVSDQDPSGDTRLLLNHVDSDPDKLVVLTFGGVSLEQENNALGTDDSCSDLDSETFDHFDVLHCEERVWPESKIL